MFTARGRIAGYGRPGAKGPAVPVRTLIGCKAYGRIVGHLPHVKAAPAIIKHGGVIPGHKAPQGQPEVFRNGLWLSCGRQSGIKK